MQDFLNPTQAERFFTIPARITCLKMAQNVTKPGINALLFFNIVVFLNLTEAEPPNRRSIRQVSVHPERVKYY